MLGILAGFVAAVLLLIVVNWILSSKPVSLHGKHVLITGGSSGIGKFLAIEAAKAGASLTLLARNQERLSEAKSEVEPYLTPKQRIVCVSVDLSKDYHQVEHAFRQAEEILGPVFMLVNAAGASVSERFDETPVDDFRRLMEANYLSAVYATRAVLPEMKRAGGGRVVFLSSQAGQLGVYGYAAYSASKFALRGFAEVLQMEAKPYGVAVTLSFPPDTDTPGFRKELEMGKPKETLLISDTSGVFAPDHVARVLLRDALRGRFLSYIGLDGFLLATVTCGVAPVSSLLEVVVQVLTMGLFRIVSLFYLSSFDRIVSKCLKERMEDEKKR
ncbi:PREDICTED: 3-ketodihydrosphingosine reductase-like [Priapulus caudatus]|uniref:3-dehydrosphinganine reductase n=1 Tax=Priapulus caudatus TaxID=37621 RepID=A0ABM1F2H7_PRICU|nr:PREDICTED: 3-ketodihydrosphingosine reductase-like [Priapulus caudatus]XP_014678652.1 PREDICTED: 3-ketodihydrosphingosine reductase-like [Priapulus caudatus]